MCSNFLELLFHENLICFVDNHVESVFVRKGLISCHEGSKTLAGHPWMRWTFTCVVTCKLIGIFESLFFFSCIHSCFSDFTLLMPSECLATHATKLSSNSSWKELLWHSQNVTLCVKLTCDKLIKPNKLYLSRNAKDNQKYNRYIFLFTYSDSLSVSFSFHNFDHNLRWFLFKRCNPNVRNLWSLHSNNFIIPHWDTVL